MISSVSRINLEWRIGQVIALFIGVAVYLSHGLTFAIPVGYLLMVLIDIRLELALSRKLHELSTLRSKRHEPTN